MARGQTQTAMQAALKTAGLRVTVCPIHTSSLRPCDQCERAFNRAERQRDWHDQAERKRLHAEWLKGKS